MYKELILEECFNKKLTVEQTAYVLATTEHETAGTFEPVREAFWKNERWREKNLRYYPYYGRGFVQLTWKHNYIKASKKLGDDFVVDPDKVMKPEISKVILVRGMTEGWFTGIRLDEYISPEIVDFFNARRVVNGLDRAQEIAAIAEDYIPEVLAYYKNKNKSVTTQCVEFFRRFM